MRRALVVASVTALAALSIPSPASADSGRSGRAGSSCAAPVPTFSYGKGVLAYGVEVDYSGCAWWDGQMIELSAMVERLDLDGEGVAVSVLCGAREVAYPDVAAPVKMSVARSCGVVAELDHPPVEVARYRGEVSWPWKGSTVTATFETVCVATPFGGHCEELPAIGL
jgi:hypothetical protein